MRSNKRIQNKRNNNRKNDIFNLSMRIKDDIFEDDIFKLNPFEDFMNLTNIFNPFELEQEEVKEEEKPKEVKEEEKPKEVKEEEKPKEVKEEKPKEVKEEEKPKEVKEEEKPKEVKEEEKPKEVEEEEINTNMKEEEPKEKEEPKKEMEIEEEEKPKENKNIYYSKIYTCSYNNINGKEESYTSQSIKQLNNEHDISETKENYKNSDGIYKSAYQRGLDGKITRFIKEKNNKTGKHNEKKIIKGLKENEINDFNKTYNEYCKKCGFKKLNYNPFNINNKQILHRLLF